ncbi:alcohol dehydrogenase catalytic domain-containing protein [Microbacterium sp. Marseille-Q6965]|uniref:alcohol dehydrogenase catalytic domain-containing protein n=1 Tax=Microbacterium sp. Marseille-Q6965 TaxID=2965072 RepID=UPI0021B7CEF0|nr:alcohol dehydrogenase catalytic domain-containing protein [Microbacterium sp. Marseille-Q6965]
MSVREVTTGTTAAAVVRDGMVSVERLALPQPGQGELLVAVDLATVCASDRTTPTSGPARVLGHEGIGRVIAAGPGAPAGVKDRVVWAPTVSCGRCDRCRGGRTSACRMLRRFGEEPVDGGWPLSGSFSAHLLLPRGAAVARVPDVLCDAVAASAGCAAATVMAALDVVGPMRGARVLVGGAGMLGLTAAAVATDRGASTVVAVDPDASRRAMARAFGATEAVAPGAALPDVDIAIVFRMSPAPAFDALAIGGTLALVGARAAAEPLTLDTARLVERRLSVAGVLGAEPRHLTEAVAYLAEARDRWPWEQLVSPAVPLSYLPTLLTQPAPVAPRAAVQPRR